MPGGFPTIRTANNKTANKTDRVKTETEARDKAGPNIERPATDMTATAGGKNTKTVMQEIAKASGATPTVEQMNKEADAPPVRFRTNAPGEAAQSDSPVPRVPVKTAAHGVTKLHSAGGGGAFRSGAPKAMHSPNPAVRYGRSASAKKHEAVLARHGRDFSPGGQVQGETATEELRDIADELEEEIVEERRGLQDTRKLAMLAIVVSALGMGAYIWFTLTSLRWKRGQIQQEHLEEIIAYFPKDPLEYNIRQRRLTARATWRRFNFRNIAIFSTATVLAMLTARWHRQYRTQVQKRKSILFWVWTSGAMTVGLLFSTYWMYTAYTAPVQYVVHHVKKNPTARGILYLLLILSAYVGFFAWKAYKHYSWRRGRKQRRIDEFRARKRKGMFNPNKEDYKLKTNPNQQQPGQAPPPPPPPPAAPPPPVPQYWK